jgi:hypothetical protein
MTGLDKEREEAKRHPRNGLPPKTAEKEIYRLAKATVAAAGFLFFHFWGISHV